MTATLNLPLSKLIVDNRISESVRSGYCLFLVKYTQDNIGIPNRWIEDIELSGQLIYLWDEDERQYVLFMLFIASVGCIVGSKLLKRDGGMFIWFAIPFGFFNQILSTFLLIVSHLPVTLLSYLIISYILTIVVNQFLKRHVDDKPTRVEYDIRLLFILLI